MSMRGLQPGNRGFTLVEVTLALGLAAFCLIGLLGLLQLGAAQNLEAGRATVASNLVSSVLADVRATSGAGPTALFQLALPTAGSGEVVANEFYVTDAGEYAGSTTGTVPAGKTPRYRVQVRFSASPAARPEQALGMFIKLWEPTVVSAAQASNFTELATSVAP